MKLSDWASDTVSLLLTSRYNNKLTTIITTNYSVGFTPQGNVVSIQPALTQQNLGERITDRVLSRLLETSVVLDIQGNDYRTTGKKAHS
jgi:DNA replication protein DnaC